MKDSEHSKTANRLTKYFVNDFDSVAFVELSEDARAKIDKAGALQNVPVPLNADDVNKIAGEGIAPTRLAERMIHVIGCDPEFTYAENYIAFLRGIFDDGLVRAIIARGIKALKSEKSKEACVQFRAAMAIEPENGDAMYGYAGACREVYMASDDEEEIGNFKAESLEYFERLTMEHPQIAEGHYYLGYAYLNLGLYIKADLAFREFLRIKEMDEAGAASDEAREIRERLAQLADSVEIEKGANDVIAGRYEKGIQRLEPFLDSEANSWWPLHYYLGAAYSEIAAGTQETTGSADLFDLATERFKSVLKLNATHLDSMNELVKIAETTGDDDMAQKYRRKIALIVGGAN